MNHPLFQSILDQPENHFLKLVWADYLEEQGKTAEAIAWRWIGKNGKYPAFDPAYPHDWNWFGVDATPWISYPESSKLSYKIVGKLSTTTGGIWGTYETQSEAYLDLVRVLVENPQFME